MPLTGWQEDSILSYTIAVDDTINSYDVVLCVRHTESYPYQNMWLFCGFGKDSIANDTIEFFLADDRGRWLGNGQAVLLRPGDFCDCLQKHFLQ